MSEIIYKYLPEKNPKGSALTGVPLADLTQAQVDAMPRWIQRSVASCEFYQDTRAEKAPKTKAAKTAVTDEIKAED